MMKESDIAGLGIEISSFQLVKMRKELEMLKTIQLELGNDKKECHQENKVVDIKAVALSMTCITRTPRELMKEMFKIQGIICDPLDLKTCLKNIVQSVKESLSRMEKEELKEGQYHAFISYRVAADSDVAEKLYYMLKLEGIEPFLDKFCLLNGEDWKVGFLRGLSNSATIIPLISSDGLKMCRDVGRDHTYDNVLLEYQMALAIAQEDTDFVVPVLVGKYPEPGMLKKFTDFNAKLYSDSIVAVGTSKELKAEEAAERHRNRIVNSKLYHAGQGERKDEYEQNFARIMCPIIFSSQAWYHPIGCCFCHQWKDRVPNYPENDFCQSSPTCIATLGYQPCGFCCQRKCPLLTYCPFSESPVTHDFVMKYPEKVTRGPAKTRFDANKPHLFHEQWNR